jgi:hypothetical protein
MTVYADDPVRTEDARAAAQAETDKVLAGLDGPRPQSVTVKAVNGFVVEELINAARTPTCSSSARAARAASAG